MPGLSLVYSAHPGTAPSEIAFQQALAEARGEPPSVSRAVFADAALRIGASGYPGYPFEAAENERAIACLEGHVYGTRAREVLEALHEIAGSLAADPEGALQGLRARIDGWEGDYVALLYDKVGRRVCLAADPTGRLPLYVRIEGGTLLVSRDQRFVCRCGGVRTPDPIGVAQLLLLGFPIGTRTLIDGVRRLSPGEIAIGEPGAVRFEPGVAAASLEEKGPASASLEGNAADLAERFVEACRIRAEATRPVVLGLSGGLDSRAVAAGLRKAGVPFEAVTFVDASGLYEKEVAVARTLARAFGVPWTEIRTPPTLGARLRTLLKMKTGLNSLGMAFSLDFFDLLRGRHVPAASFWSGDGGDKVLPDHRPRIGASQRADIVSYIVQRNEVWSLDQASRLVGLSSGRVLESVREVIERYPERSPEQRCVRFLLSERAHRWIREGEDTNRHFFWTVSPFDAASFVRAAMACPDDQKSGHRLYRAFLRCLSPATTQVPDANLGVAMDSPLYAMNRRARELSRRFPRLQRMLRPERAASMLQPGGELRRAFLTGQAESSEAVGRWFSTEELRAVATGERGANGHALECLITATCAVEEIVLGRTRLDDYVETSFG